MRKNPARKTKQGTKRGWVFVVSGPSGSGKTTLLDKLLKSPALKNLVERSVSFTTRSRRRGEINGRDYFFISESEFKRARRQEKILEWTRYLGYYYGTPRDFVEGHLALGRSVALCLDTAGARHIKRAYPHDSVTIFVLPPSLEELAQRIHGRRRETESAEINKRLDIARHELKESVFFDHRILNDNLRRALSELRRIILEYIKGRHRLPV